MSLTGLHLRRNSWRRRERRGRSAKRGRRRRTLNKWRHFKERGRGSARWECWRWRRRMNGLNISWCVGDRTGRRYKSRGRKYTRSSSLKSWLCHSDSCYRISHRERTVIFGEDGENGLVGWDLVIWIVLVIVDVSGQFLDWGKDQIASILQMTKGRITVHSGWPHLRVAFLRIDRVCLMHP